MALVYDDLSVFQNPTQVINTKNIFEPEGIPTIDLSPYMNHNKNATTLKPLLEQVTKACTEWGFFLVVNHGVPLEVHERVERVAKEFFGLPLEEKRKVAKDQINFLGYHNAENTRNVRDWKEIFEYEAKEVVFVPMNDGEGNTKVIKVGNRWPEYPIDMREACMDYAKAIEELAFKLLEIIAMTLGLPAKGLSNYFNQDSTSAICLNHYPPCPFPDLVFGVNPHTDIGALTVLAQDDVGGLEVKRRIDGKWVRVKPVPNSYIINIGDLFQVWSNDKYESAEHRVIVNPTKERFSIPFFLCPAHYTKIKPLEEAVNEDDPSKYQEFEYGHYYKLRMDSNFKHQGVEDLEIHHFKKNSLNYS